MDWIGAFAIFWLLWTGRGAYEFVRRMFQKSYEQNEKAKREERMGQLFDAFEQITVVGGGKGIIVALLIFTIGVFLLIDISGFFLTYTYLPATAPLYQLALLIAILALAIIDDINTVRLFFGAWLDFQKGVEREQLLQRMKRMFRLTQGGMAALATYGRVYLAVNLVLWTVFQ